MSVTTVAFNEGPTPTTNKQEQVIKGDRVNKKLIAAIERLREAGKRSHIRIGQEREGLASICPAEYGQTCTCAAGPHNAVVDAAAEAALAEARKLVPKYDCAKCGRDACPHSGRYPKRPGPPDGCSSFKETP